jgi:hypothetical protein
MRLASHAGSNYSELAFYRITSSSVGYEGLPHEEWAAEEYVNNKSRLFPKRPVVR